jgi:hypothetical protein
MMRRLLPCLCLVLFCASVSFAQNQDYPKWDFTVAYTLNNLETPAPSSRQNFNGFTLALGGNFRRWAAVEGDVTFTTKTIAGTRASLSTYIIGPRFTRRSSTSKLQPFVHALFGGGHLAGFGDSTNGWAGKMGGGLDILAGKHIAVRVGQIDYYRYHGHLPIGLPKQRLDNAAFTFGIRIF